MSETQPQHPNPNTPENWNARWETIGLNQNKDPWVQQRLNKVASLIPAGATVIDLAAGAALIRHQLPHVKTYVPVDFSAEALKLAEVPGIEAQCYNVPVHNDSYHTLLAMEILEHLDDPYPLIHEALRIARLQVIVTVPDDRLPPEQFPYHRRTWNEPLFTDFLRDFKPFSHVHIFHTAANLIAQCILA